jgi:energy-converting hydrogenase Eha subunit C
LTEQTEVIVIVAIIALVAACSLIVALPSIPTLDLSTLAALVTAITAVILSVIGLVQVNEMRQTRIAEYRPHLRVFLDVLKATAVFLRFVNIGRTAACDLNFQVVFEKDDTTVQTNQYKDDTMLPLDDRFLITPQSQFGLVLNKYTSVRISGTYTNGFGAEYKLDKVIDVREFIDSVNAAKMLVATGWK